MTAMSRVRASYCFFCCTLVKCYLGKRSLEHGSRAPLQKCESENTTEQTPLPQRGYYFELDLSAVGNTSFLLVHDGSFHALGDVFLYRFSLPQAPETGLKACKMILARSHVIL